MLRRLALYGTLLILTVALAGGAMIVSPVLQARTIIRDLRAMEAGPFTRERLDEWASKHGATVTCREVLCVADVSFQNELLQKLGLAPPIEFGSSIIAVDGKLSRTLLGLNSLAYSRGATTSLVVVFDDGHPLLKKQGPKRSLLQQEPIGKPLGVTYTVSRSSDPEIAELAYDLNIWCMARIGGCDAEQQSPRVWALRR